MTRTALAPGQSAAASSGRSTSVTWLTEVCRPSTFSPDSIRSFRTWASARAAGELGTVVAARASPSAAINARSRADDSATTTPTISSPSPAAVREGSAAGDASSGTVGDDPGEGLVPEPARALGRTLVVGVEAAPSAHAGLNEANPLTGPQTTKQTAASRTATSSQVRVRTLPFRRPLPQRRAAGPRPGRLRALRTLSSRLAVPARAPGFLLSPALGLVTSLESSLEPTVRVGVRAAALKEPAASRAPSGSSMGEDRPSCGARAARSRAFGRSAGSSARASVRKPSSRRAPLPPCPAHSVRRRARA